MHTTGPLTALPGPLPFGGLHSLQIPAVNRMALGRSRLPDLPPPPVVATPTGRSVVTRANTRTPTPQRGLPRALTALSALAFAAGCEGAMEAFSPLLEITKQTTGIVLGTGLSVYLTGKVYSWIKTQIQKSVESESSKLQLIAATSFVRAGTIIFGSLASAIMSGVPLNDFWEGAGLPTTAGVGLFIGACLLMAAKDIVPLFVKSYYQVGSRYERGEFITLNNVYHTNVQGYFLHKDTKYVSILRFVEPERDKDGKRIGPGFTRVTVPEGQFINPIIKSPELRYVTVDVRGLTSSQISENADVVVIDVPIKSFSESAIIRHPNRRATNEQMEGYLKFVHPPYEDGPPEEGAPPT